ATWCTVALPSGQLLCLRLVFFFSSRRRHTRFSRDWSSDVCSSDLLTFHFYSRWTPDAVWFLGTGLGLLLLAGINRGHIGLGPCRSEERRVGEEDRHRCTA